MVSGFLPHVDPEIVKYSSTGGNSISVRNVELMAQCSECLFEGWNETYADPLPMEFADGKTRLTHVVAALSIADQQEADKLLGDPLSCHVCTVLDTHYLTPEVTFPVKTAPSVLKKVVDAAGGKFLPQPRLRMRGNELAYYPGGRCDPAADKGDCSRLWYINTWVMKW